MMLSNKRIKKFLIVLALLIVNIWFWGNAALVYYFHNVFAADDSERARLDSMPERLEIPESDIEGEYLYLYGYKLKIPALKQANKVKVKPIIFARRLGSVSISIKDGNPTPTQIGLVEIPVPYSQETDESLLTRLKRWLLGGDLFLLQTEDKIYHARLSELSWWNLLGNIGVSLCLELKSMSMPAAWRNYLYEVETPHIRGFLTEVYFKGRAYPISFLHFVQDGREYLISLYSSNTRDYNIRNIIATIRPSEDTDRAYEAMEAIYKNNPGYPEGLIILSMFSLKGAVEDYQREYIIQGLKYNLELIGKTPDDESYKEKILSDIEYFEKGIDLHSHGASYSG